MYRKLKILLPTILLILFGITQYFGLFLTLDNAIHDNIMVSTRPAAENIIIVGIDERSINEIGAWPWPRYFMAAAIEQLTKMGVAAIGVNVSYDAYGAIFEYDMALVAAAEGTDRIVMGGIGILLPYEFQQSNTLLSLDDYALPFTELARVVDVGFLNGGADEDGVKRNALTTMRFGDITVFSFPFEVYQTYRRVMGQEPREYIPLDNYGMFPIRYVGGPRSFTSFSLWGVINEEYPPSRFKDAIVLIGPYATGIGEGNFPTPVDRNVVMNSVEINANIIQNMLEGIFLVHAPMWLNLSILIFSGIILILLFQLLRPLPTIIVTTVLIIAQLVIAIVIYNHFHMIIKTGDIIIFLGACYLVNLTIDIFSAQNDKAYIREVFGRFVSPSVVEQIISGEIEIQLGGTVKEITTLFVDIRGFTAFSECTPPEKVVEIVNKYLGLTSRSIQENGGTIDKYIGDATMALFNAPNDVPNHALCAVKAAWAMKQGSVALHKEILEEFGIDLQFGIGINTGVAVVGNMGSDFRMDYTAIGDAVNTAARLESNAAKGEIVISDSTYQLAKEHIEATELGYLMLKNKKAEILVYSVDNVRD